MLESRIARSNARVIESELAALLSGRCTVQTYVPVFVLQDNGEELSSQSISAGLQRDVSHRSKEQNKKPTVDRADGKLLMETTEAVSRKSFLYAPTNSGKN